MNSASVEVSGENFILYKNISEIVEYILEISSVGGICEYDYYM